MWEGGCTSWRSQGDSPLRSELCQESPPRASCVFVRAAAAPERGGAGGIKVLMLSVSLELRTNDEDDVDDVIGALWR